MYAYPGRKKKKCKKSVVVRAYVGHLYFLLSNGILLQTVNSALLAASEGFPRFCHGYHVLVRVFRRGI